MKGLIPFAKKHNIALSKPMSAEKKYIYRDGDGLRVERWIGGKYCRFAKGNTSHSRKPD